MPPLLVEALDETSEVAVLGARPAGKSTPVQGSRHKRSIGDDPHLWTILRRRVRRRPVDVRRRRAARRRSARRGGGSVRALRVRGAPLPVPVRGDHRPEFAACGEIEVRQGDVVRLVLASNLREQPGPGVGTGVDGHELDVDPDDARELTASEASSALTRKAGDLLVVAVGVDRELLDDRGQLVGARSVRHAARRASRSGTGARRRASS